ncbi:palmitoleoyl-protein carboxylesterase NOTUM [Ischnura elegans]|uniref:palmitoleoyl-protein carboxylesterase NOTUM n=1 Tax=Ischnura elegans TaxID=197161 RepID=UPI001ED8B95D|nr:palmitoleoyl-protein carboxylesterase NOTUM [Ischnura elegans]
MPQPLLSSWTFLLIFTLPANRSGCSPHSQRPQSVAQPAEYAAPPGQRVAEAIRGNTVTSNAVNAMEHLIRFTEHAEVHKPSEAARKVQPLERSEPNDPRSLKRVFLSKSNITCNDGSPAGFYIRKSRGSKEWIVFLEGGWYCYDQMSCQNRWLRLKYFMTSKQWAETRNVGGILSQNPEENPYWWDSNHIFVPYCSSDSWSGTRPQPHRWSHQGDSAVKYAFMGSYIVQEVIKDLLPLGLAQANSLLLAGSSAGGTGVIVNLDRVADNLAELGYGNIKVRGLADSGWFLDNAPYTSVSSSPSSSTFASSWLMTSPAQAVRKGVELWRGLVPERCRQDYPEEAWRCYFGYRVYPTLRAPLFVFQWLFDEAQMIADNVGPPVTKEQWNYIHRTGDSLRKTFVNVTGLFAASCISHTVLTKRDWQSIRLGNVTLPQTLHCWEMQQHHSNKIKHAESRKSHHPHRYGMSAQHHAHHGNHHKHGHNGHGHDEYMQMSPEQGSDLGEEGGTMLDGGWSQEISHTSHLRRKNMAAELKWRQESGQARNPVLSYAGNKEITSPTWNPIIYTAGGENVTHGGIPAPSTVKYAKNIIKSSLNRMPSGVSPFQSTPLQSMAPSSSPITLDDRSPLAGERGSVGEREGKGGRREGGVQEKRGRDKRRRRGERGEGRRAEGEEGHHRGARRKKVGKGTKRIKRSESSSMMSHHDEVHGKLSSSRGGDSREAWRTESRCSQRLVERCTWPQCNLSCPKLHNPLTGEEMDFIELLKSFGLDMMSVANALGIDIHTLNNMDHDELLNLLTQQSN